MERGADISKALCVCACVNVHVKESDRNKETERETLNVGKVIKEE